METAFRFERMRSARILIVDDEPTTLDVLEMFLRADGYGSIIKTSEPAAVRGLLDRERPDLLILNLMMPELDGFEILRRMRERGEVERTPVIVLTSSTDSTMKKRALELGARDFLGKPVDPSEVALRLRNVLAAHAYGSREAKATEWSGSSDGGTADSSSPAASAEPIVSRLHGSVPNLRPIIEKFVGRLHEKLAEMESSQEAGDMARLEALAHWLKGAAGTVGFDVFTRPAEELRLLAAQGKRAETENRIRELHQLFDRIQIAEEPSS